MKRQNGYNNPVVQSTTAVLSGPFTRTGVWWAATRHTLPAIMFPPLFYPLYLGIARTRKNFYTTFFEGAQSKWLACCFESAPSIFYVSTILQRQSPHRILTVFVALTDCPQQGQISFRVELGRFPSGPAPVPGWAVPPAPVRIYPSVRPM